MKLYTNTLAIILLLLVSKVDKAYAYLPGELDPAFDGDGIVTTPIGSGARANGVVVQIDGKIVAAGFVDSNGIEFVVARYHTDGSPDTDFNDGGTVIAPIGSSAGAYGVALQTDGRIVVAGYAEVNGTKFAIARYNTDGSPDTDFNNTGIVTTTIGDGEAEAFGVVVQTDGNIVVAGSAFVGGANAFAVSRYNADGSLDTDFNNTGTVTTVIGDGGAEAFGVIIQPDGKIIAAGYTDDGGYKFAVSRYNTDGSLDTDFNNTGIVTTLIGSEAKAHGVALQADGKIVAAGSTIESSTKFAIARYKTDGSLDTDFNGTGIVTMLIGSRAEAQGVVIQPDGKIVAVGYAIVGSDKAFVVSRYNTDGSSDNSFGYLGTVTTVIGDEGGAQAFGVTLQPDGKIVVAGVTLVGFDIGLFTLEPIPKL